MEEPVYSNVEIGVLSDADGQDILIDNGNCTYGEIYVGANDTVWCTNGTVYEDVEMYPYGFKIAIAILYNGVFITALIGNLLVCYVVFSSPRMRTVTNYLIVNLSVADLLMACLCLPFSYIPVLLQRWPFGLILCYLLSPAQAISVLVSSYTLVALAADRYMAILYPLRPRLRRSQACWVIALVWTIAIITATPIAIFTEYYPADEYSDRYYCEESGWKTMGVDEFKLPYGLTLMILQYFFPLVVLIFTYSRIAMAVWGKKSLGEAEDSRDQRLAKTKRKTVVMSLLQVTGFFILWLPLNLMVLVGLDSVWYPQYVFFACHSLAMAHSTYNPVIYAWMNVRFRTAFLSVLSRLNLLCPCLLKLCLSRNSSFPSTATNQFNNTTFTHHSIYARQQIYGGSNEGPNKIPHHEQLKQNNRTASQQSKPKQLAYQVANGSAKSGMDSDPLVLITIPTHQLEAEAAKNKANKMANGANKEVETNSTQQQEKSSSPSLHHPSHPEPLSRSNTPSSDANYIISNRKSSSRSPSPKLTSNDPLIVPERLSPVPSSVEIMATAREEDLLQDEDDDSDAESPVWT